MRQIFASQKTTINYHFPDRDSLVSFMNGHCLVPYLHNLCGQLFRAFEGPSQKRSTKIKQAQTLMKLYGNRLNVNGFMIISLDGYNFMYLNIQWFCRDPRGGWMDWVLNHF